MIVVGGASEWNLPYHGVNAGSNFSFVGVTDHLNNPLTRRKVGSHFSPPASRPNLVAKGGKELGEFSVKCDTFVAAMINIYNLIFPSDAAFTTMMVGKQRSTSLAIIVSNLANVCSI